MPWYDRKREAAITCPDGKRYTFIYNDTERDRTESASIFKAASVPGNYVQRLSSGGESFPLTIIFAGPDYDLTAEAFNESTKAPGVFFLEHPVFPTKKRVQLLNIKQKIASKGGDNFVTFDCSFHETIEIAAVKSSLSQETQIKNNADAANNAASDSSESNSSDDGLSNSDFKTAIKTAVDTFSKAFGDVVSKSSEYYTAFQSQYISISSEVNNIAGDVLSFAGAVSNFIALPGRISNNINETLEVYSAFLDEVENLLGAASETGFETVGELKTRAAFKMLFNVSAISAMSVASITNKDYKTRAAAISVADSITGIYDIFVAGIESDYDRFSDFDDPVDRKFNLYDTKTILNNLVSQVAGQLFALAFNLKIERKVELNRDEATIILVHRYYGYSDDNLKLFIDSNGLKGDEIFLIPAGREIKYYL